MRRIIVAGIGTGTGKTIVSSILVTLFQGEYWKPIESGVIESSDTETVGKLTDARIHPPVYSLQESLSPHEAAQLENMEIRFEAITAPLTERPLIIEMAGGVLTPLSFLKTNLDLFCQWDAEWIIVSRHYLGSINHTLLTIESLKRRGIQPLGIIFNGKNAASEEVILRISGLNALGHIDQESDITKDIIRRYAKEWKDLLIEKSLTYVK